MKDLIELDRLVFHEVNQDLWPDFEWLFESRGGPKSCWCTVWRAMPEDTSRKDSMAKRITAGSPVGLLGYLDDEPVAWCSIAPRSTYRRLVDDDSSDEGIWSITCFFVVRRLRGRGVTRRMIEAAVEHARAFGASIVEAYPVDPDSPSYRFMGFATVFEEAGFSEVGRAGTSRHVMRLKVTP